MTEKPLHVADFPIRDYRSFRFRDPGLLPGLSDLQIKSYADFLQVEVPASRRKAQGLQALFGEVFPVESHDKTMALEFHSYHLGRPRNTPDECRQLKYSYAYPLRVRMSLRKGEARSEEEVFLGDLPVMLGGASSS